MSLDRATSEVAIVPGYEGRLARVRARMEDLRVEALLCSVGADLPWLIGYEAMPLERPTVLVVTQDKVTLVVPALEAPRVVDIPELFRIEAWSDGEDVIERIAALIGGRRSLSIGDRTWSGLLLALQHRLPEAHFSSSRALVGPIRAVKDEEEVRTLQEAGAAADRVAKSLLAGEIPLLGRSEAAVSADIGRRLIDEGHSRVNFSIVGSGPNAASPHHEAGARIIARGETVVCDFGGRYSTDGRAGYCSDITRTVVTGEPSASIHELYAVLKEAQSAAVCAVSPGVTCEEIDRVGRRVIADAGYGEFFVHRIGHGIGIEEHEDPYIVEGNETVLVPGHAFSVEPGIYLHDDCGARLEDIVVVTTDGSLSCNNADHALHVVEA